MPDLYQSCIILNVNEELEAVKQSRRSQGLGVTQTAFPILGLAFKTPGGLRRSLLKMNLSEW